MANDALDPGPNGDYPYWPRNPDGSTDRERMPKGVTKRRRDRRSPYGELHDMIDVTPRDQQGNEIDPTATG